MTDLIYEAAAEHWCQPPAVARHVPPPDLVQRLVIGTRWRCPECSNLYIVCATSTATREWITIGTEWKGDPL